MRCDGGVVGQQGSVIVKSLPSQGHASLGGRKIIHGWDGSFKDGLRTLHCQRWTHDSCEGWDRHEFHKGIHEFIGEVS